MQFAIRGFLGENNKRFSEVSHKNYRKIYYLIKQVSRLSKSIIKSSEGHNLDGRQILVISMLLKILNRVENIISIIEKGIEADAIYLLRGVIEGLAIFKCLCEKEEFIEKYLGNELVENNEMLRRYIKSKNYFPTRDDEYWKYVEELFNKSQGVKFEEELKKIQTRQLFQDAGIDDIYVTAYSGFSKEVHWHPSTLLGYFFINGNKMVGINTRHDNEAAKILIAVNRYTLIALKSYCTYMKLPYINEIEKLEEFLFQF